VTEVGPTIIRLFKLWVALGLPTGVWFTGNLASGGDDVAEYTGTYELRKLHVVYNRALTGGPAQDVAITTHHFLNITSGNPDATWLTADYQQVESAFDAFWTSLKPSYSADTRLAEYRWYADGPDFKPFGETSSPMLRALTKNVAGTASAAITALPPQCAVSVTEETAARYSTVAREGRPSQLRHRWGRFYLPAPGYGALGGAAPNQGRLQPAFQTTVADAAQVFYNACRAGANLIPVMYSPTTGNAWSVDQLHVDDVFDVIRSHRFDTPISRAVRTLT
jgi:hypothetical protein